MLDDTVTITESTAKNFTQPNTDSVSAVQSNVKAFTSNIDFDLSDADVDPDPVTASDAINEFDFNKGLSSASSNIQEVAKVLHNLKETVDAFETVNMPEGLGDEFQKMKNTVKELNAKYEAMLGAMNK